MDRSTTMGGNSPHSGSTSSLSNPGGNIESAAKTAHQTVDSAADKTTEQVNRLTGTAHRAVDRAVDAAGTAMEMQARMTEAACETIRARPIATVAGALVVGYLLGRLARL